LEIHFSLSSFFADESDMDVFQTIAGLATEQVCYFRCDPPITDFTQKYDGKFIILTPTRSATFLASEVGLDIHPLDFYHILQHTIFAKDHIVLTWDIKKLNSFLKYRLEGPSEPPGARVIDLKYGLAYQGDRKERPPETIREALSTAKGFTTKNHWKLAQSCVFDPLAWRVLPDLETQGVIDASRKEVLYTSYEIEGQKNGRLKVKQPSSKFLTVHSMSPTQKAALQPRCYLEGGQWRFVVLDFENMEVSTLAWLAKDKNLQAALSSEGDFYTSLIPVDVPGWPPRKLGKLIFLPVLYGLQSRNLAEKLKIPSSAADTIITSLKGRFPQSFQWIEAKEAELKETPLASDYFGRQRDFSNEPPYKRRNFEVQSPASLICLERLCALHEALSENLLIHIHDGYVLVAPLRTCVDVIHIARDILESESSLSPGLSLKTACQVGQRLDQLQNIHFPRN